MTFRLEITQVGKFPTSWNLTKLQIFDTYTYLSMRGPTLPFAPTKTYSPISIDLREKRKKKKISLSSHSNSLPSVPLLPFLTFIFLFFYFFLSSFLFFLIFFYLSHYFLHLTLGSMRAIHTSVTPPTPA